jgi:hypothetical protein
MLADAPPRAGLASSLPSIMLADTPFLEDLTQAPQTRGLSRGDCGFAEAAEQDTAALARRAPYGTSPCQPSIIPTIDKAARMFGLGGGRLTSDSSVSLS